MKVLAEGEELGSNLLHVGQRTQTYASVAVRSKNAGRGLFRHL